MSNRNFEFTFIESAARIVAPAVSEQQNDYWRGVALLVNISDVGSPAGSLTGFKIQAKIGSSYVDIYNIPLVNQQYSQSAPKQIHISNFFSASHVDITAVALDPVSGTATVLGVNTDFVYVGLLQKFNVITVDVTTPASADTGLLVAEFWNGTAWQAVSGLVDGTAVQEIDLSIHTFRQDGAITFTLPTTWVKNDVPATGTSLYYVRFKTTTNAGTDPIVQLIAPTRALGAVGQAAFLIYPDTIDDGLWYTPPVRGIVPKNWGLLPIHADANSITYSVKGCYLL